VRGLKHLLVVGLITHSVAPPAGAWIETGERAGTRGSIEVAPPAGAWIETVGIQLGLQVLKSHPLRVRGLKRR